MPPTVTPAASSMVSTTPKTERGRSRVRPTSLAPEEIAKMVATEALMANSAPASSGIWSIIAVTPDCRQTETASAGASARSKGGGGSASPKRRSMGEYSGRASSGGYSRRHWEYNRRGALTTSAKAAASAAGDILVNRMMAGANQTAVVDVRHAAHTTSPRWRRGIARYRHQVMAMLQAHANTA